VIKFVKRFVEKSVKFAILSANLNVYIPNALKDVKKYVIDNLAIRSVLNNYNVVVSVWDFVEKFVPHCAKIINTIHKSWLIKTLTKIIYTIN
jgi:hypothetical protein